MNTIAIEDLMTVVIDMFIEGAREIAGSDDIVIEDWYRGLDDAEKRKVSDQLLDIIKKDNDKVKDG